MGLYLNTGFRRLITGFAALTRGFAAAAHGDAQPRTRQVPQDGEYRSKGSWSLCPHLLCKPDSAGMLPGGACPPLPLPPPPAAPTARAFGSSALATFRRLASNTIAPDCRGHARCAVPAHSGSVASHTVGKVTRKRKTISAQKNCCFSSACRRRIEACAQHTIP